MKERRKIVQRTTGLATGEHGLLRVGAEYLICVYQIVKEQLIKEQMEPAFRFFETSNNLFLFH